MVEVPAASTSGDADRVRSVSRSAPQEAEAYDDISRYFNHPIPPVQWDDEEAYVAVLKEAGLTDG